ncbi:MAG: rhomboid family intramembrane serine protease [Spirochaetales bacterium]|nr:rhomboid family intramembrane serine protease [Spirochaetales bacterium]
MFPIGDENGRRRGSTPLVMALLALNVAAFLFLQQCGADPRVASSLGAVPQELIEGRDIMTADQRVADPWTRRVYLVPGLGETPVWVYLTVVTSMFLHGSLGHLFGNMLYLWIFGDNVEGRLGRTRFALLYLLSGVAGVAAHVTQAALTGRGLLTPMIGASGAISGILGAYLAFFPRNRVYVLTFGFLPAGLPALVVIGLWFALQLVNGLGGASGGVAWMAHVGGFVTGWLLAKVSGGPKKPPVSGASDGVEWTILE